MDRAERPLVFDLKQWRDFEAEKLDPFLVDMNKEKGYELDQCYSEIYLSKFQLNKDRKSLEFNDFLTLIGLEI